MKEQIKHLMFVLLISLIFVFGMVILTKGSPFVYDAIHYYANLIDCAGFRNNREVNCMIRFAAITFFVGFIIRQIMKYIGR